MVGWPGAACFAIWWYNEDQQHLQPLRDRKLARSRRDEATGSSIAAQDSD